MRTTVSIDDALLARAKKSAAERGQTLGQFVEESVRFRLVAADPVALPVRLPVLTGGNGMRAGIDPASNRALYDALDDGDDPA